MQNRIIKIFLRVIFLVAFAGSVFAQVNLALNKPCVASSIENVDLNAAAAFDGNSGTRWSSVFSDPQWIYVDLGATYAISRVVLNWETAFASGYSIQVSGNAGSWTTVYATSTGNGGIDDLAVSGSGRYLRLYGTARGTEWGYSLWEFEVYGGGSVTATPTAIPTATPATAAGNVALNRSAVSSSNENTDLTAGMAFDGNGNTRWASAYSDPQWIYVDLGTTYSISRVVLNWETAYGSAYSIQVSGNASAWTTVYSTSGGNGGIDDLTVNGSGRYVRMYGTTRGTGWGYSLWEFEVYASGAPVPTATPTPAATPTITPTAKPTAAPTAIPTATPITAAGNLALNRPAVSSSNENTDLTAGKAFDGNAGTRWASAYSDPQWIYVDLGATYSITRVILNWETAYASAYSIQVSGNATSWSTIYSTSGGNGGIDDLTVNGSGRYVRMYGTTRGTGWGYSLWEFEVYSTGGPVQTPVPTATPAGGYRNYFRDDFNSFDTSIWQCEYTCPTVSNGMCQFILKANVAPNNAGSWSKIRFKPQRFTSGSFTIRFALNRRPTQAVWWGEALWDNGPSAEQFNEINFGYTTSQSFTNTQLYFESARLGQVIPTKVDLGVNLYDGSFHIGKLVYDSNKVEFWFDGVLRATVTDTRYIATDPMDFIIGPRLVATPNLTSDFIMSVDYTEIEW